MAMMRVVVKGRVQGVGYRAWCAREAQALELRGWVRNRHDGSVEALFMGSAEHIEMMREACHAGPALARVDEVRVLAHEELHAQSMQLEQEEPHFLIRETAGPDE